jgi:uncharacterized SAM-binding protein YcdF (DUF218 family)
MDLLFNVFTNPAIQFLFLLGLAALFRFLKKGRASNVALAGLLFWFFLISTAPISQWLIFNLENRHKSFQAEGFSKDSINILVLGGGHSTSHDNSYLGQLVSVSVARLTEAIRIHYRIPGSHIVCSGNSIPDGTTQAEITSLAALELGVNFKDTMQIRSPKNTVEEIKAYKKRFGTKEPFILVTSAFHMPRAMLICKHEGLQAIPAPTDFYFKNEDRRSFNFKPSVQKMKMFQIASHEWGGMFKIWASYR